MRTLSNFQCRQTIPVPGDQLDNDCDLEIDEEIKDGKDNDGDHYVDEDLQLVELFMGNSYTNFQPLLICQKHQYISHFFISLFTSVKKLKQQLVMALTMTVMEGLMKKSLMEKMMTQMEQ